WRGEGPNSAAYTAAKAAAGAFLRSAAAENPSLRAGIVYPLGAIDTPSNRQSMPKADPDGWIDPRAVAEALVFLASRGPRGLVQEVLLRAQAGRKG
ncbi:MAG TPA: hypothetical protein VHN99_04535, partial [Deinococcales bacterium]|nr:hypothetical protein [Deinococcales bacterium]